jgi:hypothetical protein
MIVYHFISIENTMKKKIQILNAHIASYVGLQGKLSNYL